MRNVPFAVPIVNVWSGCTSMMLLVERPVTDFT